MYLLLIVYFLSNNWEAKDVNIGLCEVTSSLVA
jgi:hypothetical protein